VTGVHVLNGRSLSCAGNSVGIHGLSLHSVAPLKA
jgi:hypothetical protein